MSRVGEVWVFHDDRSRESYIWLVVKESASYLDMMNLESGDLAIIDEAIPFRSRHGGDGLWWERIA